MRASLTAVALVVTASVSMTGGEPLKLAVSPTMCFAPGNLMIRARITPNAENRSLTIAAVSGEFYRSSEVQLEGDQAPAVLAFEFRGLPDGEYIVSGTLGDTGGRRRAFSQQHVTIVPTAGR